MELLNPYDSNSKALLHPGLDWIGLTVGYLALFDIYRYDISIVDISALLKNIDIDIDMEKLKISISISISIGQF